MTTPSPTDRQILDAAQSLMQVRGYNAFSYADISDEVGVRKATIHYHFPGKADLARAVVARYRADTRAMMDAIDRETRDPRAKIEQYIALYGAMVHGGPRICLCAVLAAETPTLPAAVQSEVRGFFADHEAWLGGVLAEGVAAGTLRLPGRVEGAVLLLRAGIEGAMLTARAHGDPARFDAVTRRLLDTVVPPDGYLHSAPIY
ncbi:MAG: TetR/AcrR family transcriptional regulator [Chloroflexota bacterium]